MITKTIKIGDFKVNPIGIGTWGIGGYMEAEYGDEEKDSEAIRYSINKGQNHIDTAEMYGNGHAEEIVAQAIKGFDRKKLFITSKVHRNYSTSKNVVKSTENILKRLQTDYIDLLYIHSYWEDEKMEEWLINSNKAVDMGLAKNLGVSNWTVENLKWGLRKTKNPIVANQMNFNILHQTEVPEIMREFCDKANVIIVAYRPLDRGLLANKSKIKIVLELVKKYKKTPAQIALNWLISQKNVLTIPKSTDKKHIDENFDALDFELQKDDVQLLDHL